ncbi:MAG: eukaryotic-like serine/threonine-protein kinase [Actinomycetota bacterium]|nr:eukaryotic-like serine/threonine-protein kinase [Actinomycetota bacterium]
MVAAQDGDRGALDTLLRRHHDRIYALCRRVTGSDADGADACQEALVAIVRGLDRFDGRSAFGTWAYRVATNACLDELRRRRRRPEPGLPEDAGESSGGAGPRVGGTGGRRGPGDGGGGATGPADAFGAVDTRLAVDAALARLPTDFRVAVVLRDLCGLAYDEIAEMTGVPVGTVRSRIARGRAALVPLLSPGGNAPGGRQRPKPRA